MLTTILIFAIILGLLVFVHEFGHFIVAKKTGMQVDEFGFGFPPRMGGIQKVEGKWKWVWGHRQPPNTEQTVYSINWIPLGGFVKIRGENNDNADDPHSFINRPFWARFGTLVAGVAMNVILAWVLISIGFIVGIPAAIDTASSISPNAVLKDARMGIVEVIDGSPAAKAGIKPGDTIVSVDGQSFSDIKLASRYILGHGGQIIDFQIQRESRNLDIKVQSRKVTDPNQGATGIALANVGTLTVPWYLAFWEGGKATVTQIQNIISGLYYLVTAKIGLSSLGGPIKIFQLTGEVRAMGFIYLLQFTSFLSLNLAVLNILPFPALDGGRVLFLIIEKIRRKRNNPKIEQFANTAGFVFLILLMVLVTIKDVRGL